MSDTPTPQPESVNRPQDVEASIARAKVKKALAPEPVPHGRCPRCGLRMRCDPEANTLTCETCHRVYPAREGS